MSNIFRVVNRSLSRAGLKELSFCHTLYFSNIFTTQCRRPLIFQTMNSVRPNNLSLKYQRFTSSDCKDIGIRQLEFVKNNSAPLFSFQGGSLIIFRIQRQNNKIFLVQKQNNKIFINTETKL